MLTYVVNEISISKFRSSRRLYVSERSLLARTSVDAQPLNIEHRSAYRFKFLPDFENPMGGLSNPDRRGKVRGV